MSNASGATHVVEGATDSTGDRMRSDSVLPINVGDLARAGLEALDNAASNSAFGRDGVAQPGSSSSIVEGATDSAGDRVGPDPVLPVEVGDLTGAGLEALDDTTGDSALTVDRLPEASCSTKSLVT